VGCFTRQHTTSDVRIQVGTAGGLDLADAKVVLFTDARHVLHERVRRYVLFLRRQRIYGLLDGWRGLSRRERLVIEGHIGPAIGQVGPADDDPVEVLAVFADWPGGERPDEPLGLDWKRHSIWRNSERNRAIAQVAAALAGGDTAALWPYGLFLDGVPAIRPPEDRRVVVLVESPEHARVLGDLLPGWPVLVAGESTPREGSGPGAVGGGQEDLDGPPRAAIMTWLHAHVRGCLEADVVSRADGTPWPLELPLASPGREEHGGGAVRLVDLADHQDRTARDAARARRLDYRDRGWYP
jgi:hypothetical protein